MTERTLFGTDGIRGNSSTPPLWPEHIAKLGRIIGSMIKDQALSNEDANPTVIIGRDTRASGLYLEHALIAGLTSTGLNCQLLGVLPTSAVAIATRANRASAGVMISASHNPHHDNGLKIFDAEGFKLQKNQETEIEQRYFSSRDQCLFSSPPGRVVYDDNASLNYQSLLTKAFLPMKLNGLRMVIDCAHGAASFVASTVFKTFGADVITIGNAPSGSNINRQCGSEEPSHIKQAVIKHRADFGIAFDGDADRVIFVDERGELINGDAILACFAIELHRTNRLRNNTLVTTVMSSRALDNALAQHNVDVIRTTVGDKFVARMMKDRDFSFGGEASGHLISFPETTTGDGIFSALRYCEILQRAGTNASKLTSFFEPCPQVLKNVVVKHKLPLEQLPKTKALIEEANQTLENYGRVMFRYSGTENTARILVEAATTLECQRIAEEIARQFDDEVTTTALAPN